MPQPEKAYRKNDYSFDEAYRKSKRQRDRNLIVTKARARKYYETQTEKSEKEKIAVRKKILKKLFTLRRYEATLENINSDINFTISSTLAIKIQKSLVDTVIYKDVQIDQIADTFKKTLLKSLSFYEILMLKNAKKEYDIYKDYEFNFYIEMFILKEFHIKEKYRSEIYELLYQELFDFLEKKNIKVGKYGILCLKKKNIILMVEKEFSSSAQFTPHKFKKVSFEQL